MGRPLGRLNSTLILMLFVCYGEKTLSALTPLLRTIALSAALFAVATVIEACILRVWKRTTGWRLIRQVVIANTVSGLLYMALSSLPFFAGNPDSPIPDLITPLLFMFATWMTSTVSEGVVLDVLDQAAIGTSWGTAFVLNTASGIPLLLCLIVLSISMH